MKRNIFSDNKSGKSSKGFYAALGISAVMIGSACYFAYSEGEKLTKNDNSSITAEESRTEREEAVDKKAPDIPKFTTAATTAPRVQTTTIATTVAPTTTANIATIPAAGVVTAIPPASEQNNNSEQVQTAADKLANVTSPLTDISNIITPFSGTELVKSPTTGSWQTHNGVDIAAEVGTEVFAISPGEITAVNEDPLWGITVVIDHHNGYITKYCSLAKDLSVQKGDSVVSGDVIGVVSDTADIESAVEPHLHLEIMHNGSYVDPVSIINS